MTPASVGFQCPECVAEGRRTQRAPRASLGSTIRMAGAPVTWTLIGINVVVFLLMQVVSGTIAYDLMLHARGFCSVTGVGDVIADHAQCTAYGGSFSPGVADGGYWELLTSVFTHQALLHVATNMFSLWVIGPLLEMALGRTRYLLTYLLCGLAGSALVYWSASPYSPTLGASGAIFGLLGALIVLFVRRGLPIQQLILVAVINFAITFTNSGISWQGHVGGFVAGLAIGGVLAYAPGPRHRHLRWAGLALVTAVVVIAIVVRSLQLR
jgi:membrane associated rhomboid family serine protease